MADQQVVPQNSTDMTDATDTTDTTDTTARMDTRETEQTAPSVKTLAPTAPAGAPGAGNAAPRRSAVGGVTIASSRSSRSNSAAQTPASEAQRQQALLRDIVTTVLLSALLFLMLHATVLVLPLVGPSMQPGLHTDERILVNELAYTLHGPQRGDVIVFHPPILPNESYIKRVIGLPGDVITITLNNVYVNGCQLSEPYIAADPDGAERNPTPQADIHLGPDQYWVMGDNRNNSEDSRAFGPITRSEIEGQAVYVAWPLANARSIPTYSASFNVNPATCVAGNGS